MVPHDAHNCRGLHAPAVQALRWERSQHVAHLLKHNKEYTAALFGFLADCKAGKGLE